MAVEVHGTVASGFEAVRDVFNENFSRRKELGAACAVYLHGDKVVDLWGGRRDEATGAPWERDTMVMVFSTTKGMSAAALAVAHSRGLFELDEPVAKYWPEFARNSKERITVRHLLSHQAGLCVVDEPLDARKLADLDVVASALAAQRPAWEAGERQGYHAVTLGWYEGELLRRVDPQRRSLGRFFREEVATPLGVEFHIGLPSDVAPSRIATLEIIPRSRLLSHLHKLPWRFVVAMGDRRSLTARAFANPRIGDATHLNKPEYRAVEMPASNGIGGARDIARVYGSLATGGAELGITRATFEALTAPPRLPRGGARDEVLRIDTAFSMGFLKPCEMSRYGSNDKVFGTPGMGGSFGFADPDLGLGFAYVMNRMGVHVADDPREKALRDATYRCVKAAR